MGNGRDCGIVATCNYTIRGDGIITIVCKFNIGEPYGMFDNRNPYKWCLSGVIAVSMSIPYRHLSHQSSCSDQMLL